MRSINRTLTMTLMGVICISPLGFSESPGQNEKDISLDELLNTRIHTAAKYEQKISQAPASVTIITAEDIERYGYRTLDEALMTVRGFFISNDRNYAYLGVRGFSRPTDYNNRILLLIDGHSLNENVYGSALVGTEFGLDMGMIERIEIVRGPGSALYGTNAMFTVINVITKRGNDLDGFNMIVETGSFGRYLGSALFGKELDSGLELFLSGQWGWIKGQDLYFEAYDDTSTNNGLAKEIDEDTYYGLLTRLTYGDFSLQGMLSSREKGIPTGAWEMAFNDDDAMSLDERAYVEWKFDHELSLNKNVTLRGYFDHYGFEGTYPYEDIDWYDASDGNWLGGEFQFRWDLRTDNRLITGVEYQNHLRADYRNWDEDTTYFEEDFPFHIYSFYIHDEYQVTHNFSLTLGARIDEYSTVGSRLTPRGGIIYSPMKSGTMKLLYGEAFRAPNVYETYYEDPDIAKNNPDIDPEKIRTAEIVWEHQLISELFGTISLYNNEMNDLIDQIVDPSDSLTQFRNISEVEARGFEFGLRARLETGMQGYLNYAYQKVKDAHSDEKLTNSPNHLLKMGVACPLFNRIYATAEIQYETERTTVHSSETDSYLLAHIHFLTKPVFNHFRFSLLVRNLFDESYGLPGGVEHIQYSIPQDGRNITLGMECSF